MLAILAMGYLGYALLGHAGLLLSMTRHERTVGKTLGFTALLNMALNGALIPSRERDSARQLTLPEPAD